VAKPANMTIAGFLGGAALGTLLSSMIQHSSRRRGIEARVA